MTGNSLYLLVTLVFLRRAYLTGFIGHVYNGDLMRLRLSIFCIPVAGTCKHVREFPAKSGIYACGVTRCRGHYRRLGRFATAGGSGSKGGSAESVLRKQSATDRARPA